MEPKFRCVTKKALEELAIELNLRERIPYWDSIAGYSYTPSNPEDLQQYLDHYSTLKDDDKKFTLMEMILDAIAGQSNENEFLNYWDKLQPILITDYLIHEFTIHYWKDMDGFASSNLMTPLIQKLIFNKNIA